MTVLFAMVLGALGVWFWMDSLRARERALHVCGGACRRLDVQLLDETVALCGLGVGRGEGGYLQLRRRYHFEFSSNGSDRWQGRVVLLGTAVQTLQMDYPDGSTTIVETGNVRQLR
ncbi:MAG TPA: DUF3301 domain-containing protein [Gammaproteobacteria bacterium]|nr:DUF3301 domain-containing protein [Gammaproteobacteria bacterium]